jgi:hypothetical protein
MWLQKGKAGMVVYGSSIYGDKKHGIIMMMM